LEDGQARARFRFEGRCSGIAMLKRSTAKIKLSAATGREGSRAEPGGPA
jgi:hypothetical protein